MRLLLRAALLLWTATLPFFAAATEPITLLTEEKAPDNFMGPDGKVTGIGTEIVDAIFKQAKVSYTAQVQPWARAYETALKTKDVGLFTTARTAERENSFYWIGPLIKKQWVFFAKEDSNIKIDRLEDAKKYRIAVYNQSALQRHLVEKGFEPDVNLDIATKEEFNAGKLQSNKVQLWATGRSVGFVNAKTVDMKVKQVFSIRELPHYVVFNKDSDPKLMQRLQAAYDEIKDGKVIADIYKKYDYDKTTGF